MALTEQARLKTRFHHVKWARYNCTAHSSETRTFCQDLANTCQAWKAYIPACNEVSPWLCWEKASWGSSCVISRHSSKVYWRIDEKDKDLPDNQVERNKVWSNMEFFGTSRGKSKRYVFSSYNQGSLQFYPPSRFSLTLALGYSSSSSIAIWDSCRRGHNCRDQ